MTAQQSNSSSLYSSLSPSDFGLPAKFEQFRTAQAQALEWAVYECRKKFTAAALPTGEGKSLFGVALAKILGVKAAYLTATLNLEDQVGADFRQSGLVDCRGRSNYICSQLWPGRRYKTSCEYGHQHECSLEHTDRCGHTAANLAAEHSDVFVTNYSNWMHKRKYNKKAFEQDGRPIELLICDEAGDVAEQISSFVSVEVLHADEELPISAVQAQHTYRTSGRNPSGVMSEVDSGMWVSWARERQREAAKQMARIADGYPSKQAAAKDDRYVYLADLIKICERIQTLDSNWVWEVDERGVKFQPIWPGQLASALWSGVPRIVLMSATLRPYTLGLLGIPESQYDFREWPSSFLPQLAPFYYQPSGVSLSWRSKDKPEDYKRIISMADAWIDARPGRRVIVHSGSYERARMFKEISKHGKRRNTIYNESSKDAQGAALDFTHGPEDSILVGPSYTTGSNFPNRDCELQIILKTPFPDESSRVMKERCKNKDYRMHVTVDKIVQIKGRNVRNHKDRGETVVFDDRIKWAMGRGDWHGHAPKHFKCQLVNSIPPAPPRVSK